MSLRDTPATLIAEQARKITELRDVLRAAQAEVDSLAARLADCTDAKVRGRVELGAARAQAWREGWNARHESLEITDTGYVLSDEGDAVTNPYEEG